MRSYLFIHASFLVRNKCGLPSKILSKINGSTIFEMLLNRMRNLSIIEKIVVVTSVLDCDREIAEITEKFVHSNDKFELIRIEQGKTFSFDEKNKSLEPNLLYKLPAYGFYNSGFFKNYCSANRFDAAVLITADDTPLIEPELIDWLITKYHKNGVIYGSRYPGENVLVLSADALSKIMVCKHNLDRKFKDEINSIEDDITQIKSVNPAVDIEQFTAKKKEVLNNKYKRDITVFDILYSLDVKKVVANHPLRYQFYPVYRKTDIRFLKTFFADLMKISLDDYDNAVDNLKSNINKLKPSTLEIELTNRCNLNCDSCPHCSLDREEVDISKEQFLKILESFSPDIQYLVFSGFGEPALHRNLFDFIKLAKEKEVLSVCIETNGVSLDEQFINNLIDSKLDILTINIDALDIFYSGDLSKTESVIDMVYDIKRKRGCEKPYLVIQTINRMSNQDRVQYYYKRWYNIADCVLIQPFNDYCDTYARSEQINLAPLTLLPECSKTSQSQLVFADGSLTLCKQKFNGFMPSEFENAGDIWIDNYYRGNYFDFCRNCIIKYYRECVQPDRFNSSFQFKIDREILSNHIDNVVNQGENFYKENKFQKALSVWEQALKYYPDNPAVRKKLENLEKLI